MPTEFENCALMKFLAKDRDYHARILMLRKELDKWLQYTISLFPHYTSHTRDHSEQIILQLSKILFRKGKPTVALSFAEAYILICAAYFHDAGMVVSPGEIEELLASDRWRKFVSGEGKGAALWREIEALRAKQDPALPDLSAYRADVQLRLLLADFFRREHHLRARLALQLHPALRQLIDFNDRRYFEAIASIAVGHGLNRSELNDSSRFREVADIGGEQVNIQFIARLLRIGDLLDLRAARADPYSCVASNPLPPDSVPHWKQYSTIVHERVDSLRIEYECECKDQDTHAVLRDWFGWLVDEVRDAGIAMLHAERHSGWRPPVCTIDDEWLPSKQSRRRPPTIIIRPAEDAAYTFNRWRLELDQEQVLDRLIYDVYESPETFIRELLQNALDAVRCRMYQDFPKRYPSVPVPLRPTQFPEEFLKEYPIKISLRSQSGPAESSNDSLAQVFSIEDMGTGMDSKIIQRYFLQVGRSFYRSEEFKRHFKFSPTSRFGVGFLSVFAVSNLVVVETAKAPLPADEPYGLRLTLRGPKSYLLTERCSPFKERPLMRQHGTRICVTLDKPIKNLSKLLHAWCRRVEVPIEVDDLGVLTTITTERIKDRSVLAPSVVNPEARFELRAFPVSTANIEGEIYRLAYIDARGESWIDDWDHSTDITGSLIERIPFLPEQYRAFHGITSEKRYFDSYSTGKTAWGHAVDDRSPSTRATLARTSYREFARYVDQSKISPLAQPQSELDSEISLTIQRALAEHLRAEPRAMLKDRWRYASILLSDARVPAGFAWSWPGTTPVEIGGKEEFLSASEVSRLDSLIVLFREDRHKNVATSSPPRVGWTGPVIGFQNAPPFLREWIIDQISQGRIKAIKIFDAKIGSRWAAITLGSMRTAEILSENRVVVPFGKEDTFILELGAHGTLHVLNVDHPMVQWAMAVLAAARQGTSSVTPAVATALLGKVSNPMPDDFDEFLRKWRQQGGIPTELMPPQDWDWHKLYGQTLRLI